jgi:hypothetical protein
LDLFAVLGVELPVDWGGNAPSTPRCSRWFHVGILWSRVEVVREQAAPLASDFVPWGKLTLPFGLGPT